MNRSVLLVVAAAVLGACGGGPVVPSAQASLRKIAAFDLGCEESKLEVVEVSGECGESEWNLCNYGVRGCGSSARYMYRGDNGWTFQAGERTEVRAPQPE